jgi:branched-chain amino acid transport system substrate-binding protein
VADETWTQLKLKRVQLIGKSWWKVEPDFTPYTSILAAKPDAVIIAAGGASCVPFLKAAKATGFNERVPFIAHMAIELSTLKPLGMNAPAGVMGTSPYLFYFPELPENKAFTDKYKKAFDRYPTAGSFCGYISGLSIAKAFESRRCGPREIHHSRRTTMDSGRESNNQDVIKIMLPMFVG